MKNNAGRMIRTTENNIPNSKSLTKGQLKFLNKIKYLPYTCND